ncbi:MAG: hypothetical protein ACXVJD_12105 [Mucilaginibacter sp.]
MKMQDKEFDGLFRSKLETFESEPTGQVWDNIVEGLDGKRRNRSLVPFLSIAASVIVLIAAGMLFIPQKAAVTVKSPHKNTRAKATSASAVPVIKHDSSEPIRKNLQRSAAAVSHIAKVRPIKITQKIATSKNNTAGELREPTPVAEQPVLAAIPQAREAIIPVVPDNETPLTIKQTPDENPAFITKPVLAAGSLPAFDKQNNPAAKPKHKIHTLGGLLNVMIAKVDKRKDKIIEFTDTDDDESNITAVNLGIIKFKKEKDSK